MGQKRALAAPQELAQQHEQHNKVFRHDGNNSWKRDFTEYIFQPLAPLQWWCLEYADTIMFTDTLKLSSYGGQDSAMGDKTVNSNGAEPSHVCTVLG